jgi:hypothetical protein
MIISAFTRLRRFFDNCMCAVTFAQANDQKDAIQSISAATEELLAARESNSYAKAERGHRHSHTIQTAN